MAKITVAQLAKQLEELATQNAKLQAELAEVKASKSSGRSRLTDEEKAAKKAAKDVQRAEIKTQALHDAEGAPRVQGMYFRPSRPGLKGRVWVKGALPPSPCVVTCFSQVDGSQRQYFVSGEWQLTKKGTGYTQCGAVRIDDADSSTPTPTPTPTPTASTEDDMEDFLKSLG